MKKKLRLVAALVVAGMLLCVAEPSVATAGYYDFPAYFAADTSVSSDGTWGWAFSANFECLGDNQSVQVFSVMYYREVSTGNGGSNKQYSASDSGVDCYAEFYCYPPSAAQEISLINSIHNGYWMLLYRRLNPHINKLTIG